MTKHTTLSLAAFAATGIGLLVFTQQAEARPPKPPLATPVITSTVDPSGIIIHVCAGSTGLPNGFSLQWIKESEFNAGPDGVAATADDNSWPVDEVLHPNQPSFCTADFSGSASGHFYRLAAGACIDVTPGNFDTSHPGFSSTCLGGLDNATYLFRAFGKANSQYKRSAWTANLEAGVPLVVLGFLAASGCAGYLLRRHRRQ